MVVHLYVTVLLLLLLEFLMPSIQGIYSEQKNCPTKGQISLVRQIAAQITKVNPWEICITKVDILSFVIPKYRSLVNTIVLIYILQYGTLDGTVFLLVLGLGPFGLYHSLCPSGHALNQISTHLLWYFFPFHLHPVPKLMYTSRRDLICIELLLEVLPQVFNRVEVR